MSIKYFAQIQFELESLEKQFDIHEMYYSYSIYKIVNQLNTKLNIKIDNVLNTFHPDGNDYYNLTNSIKETCKKLESL